MKRGISLVFILSIVLASWTSAALAEEKVLLPDSRKAGQKWAYTFTGPPAEWMKAGFDDSKWQRGQGGFGRRGTPGAVVRTSWHSRDIWLRKTFTLAKLPKKLAVDLHHDEGAEVYLNGKLVLRTEKYLVGYKRFLLPTDAVAALKSGKNVIAIHCRQTVGGQYIDAGLVADPDKNKDVAVRPNLPQPLDPNSPEALAFFEKKVKPLLTANCFRCHGGKRVRGGLNLTHRQGVLKGGDTGPAVNLNNPAASHLLAMISYRDADHQMPPKGKLPETEINILTKWVQMGAPMTVDQTAKATEKEQPLITKEARNYWAYKKPVRPQVPKVKNQKWVTNPIDAFILAKLEAKGLTPAPPLDRVRLIRRATYDLTGLPPTPKQVQDFLQDKSSNAYNKLLDRLLASPHYGEKWGRHWLDLVRYAESNGYEYDEAKPNAWRYRDYVIKAFNDDKPYNRFLMEQIAGDELKDANDETRIATIYYRLGIFDTHAADGLQRDFDMYDDIVKTTGEVVLGMTLGCARCHNHKKDPIPQADYYRFLSFFRNIRPDWRNPVVEHGPQPRDTHILVRGNAHVKGKEVKPGFPQVLGFDDPHTPMPRIRKSSGRRLTLAKWMAGTDNPLTARVMINRIWQHHFGRGIVPTPNDFGKLGLPPTHPQLLDWLAVEFMKRGWSIKAMHKLIMTSSAYRMSSQSNPQAVKVDPNNDLFWRFNMRRLTAEEVRDSILAVDGTLDRKVGGPSVYPELPLAVIRTSSRFDRRTGFIGAGYWKKPRPEYEVRRSVYTFVRRSLLPPMLSSLDLADTDASCPVRFTTTVPTQSLILMNSKFMHDHAKLFAKRLRKEAGKNTRDQVRRALQLVTQRTPTEKEIARGLRLIRVLEGEGISGDQALQHFCLVAVNLNEFMYVD